MTDRRLFSRESARFGTEAGGPTRVFGLLLVGLFVFAMVLPGCGSGEEMTNRDRLPRRTAGEAPPPEPVPVDTTQAPGDPGYQPAPVRDGLFTSFGDYERQRAAAVADLEAAIGTPRATMARACKTIPVGAKACGGPRSFAVYTATGDAEFDIIRLAGLVTALDREANEQFGLNSDCMLLTAPEVILDGGVCTVAEN
ncbi:MAG: hypothetical protein AAGI52_05105 [Bacteroidota bacterium]